MTMVEKGRLTIAAPLAAFIADRALPGTGLDRDAFWAGLGDIYRRFRPENAELLSVRDDLQGRIDA